jgi:hypothetical protein
MLNQSFIAMSASFAMVFMFRAVPNSSGRDFQFGTVHAAAVMHIYLAGFNASVRACKTQSQRWTNTARLR